MNIEGFYKKLVYLDVILLTITWCDWFWVYIGRLLIKLEKLRGLIVFVVDAFL
jgi:hypothetical protein